MELIFFRRRSKGRIRINPRRRNPMMNRKEEPMSRKGSVPE